MPVQVNLAFGRLMYFVNTGLACCASYTVLSSDLSTPIDNVIANKKSLIFYFMAFSLLLPNLVPWNELVLGVCSLIVHL